MSPVGRNDSCPCGSGAKYKRCCLSKDLAPLPGQDWHDLDGRLVNEIARFARRRFGSGFDERAHAYIEILERDPLMASMVIPFLAYELHLEGRPAVDWFAEERGRNLAPNERRWLDAQQRSWLSVWEVISVDPGKGMDLKDLLTGQTRSVLEVSGSRILIPHLSILARVVDVDGLWLCCGTHPRTLPPTEAARVVAGLRAELGNTKLIPPQRLREQVEDVLEAWNVAVREMDQRPPPTLKNTDGHELVMVTSRFKYVGADARARIGGLLRGAADVLPPEPGERTPDFAFVRPGKADQRGLENTILGHVRLMAREIRLETNSLERADALTARLASLLGGRIRFAGREEKNMEALTDGPPPRGRRSVEATGPEADTIIRAFKEQHYGAWADHELPALGGLTPREAARSAGHRADLALLLKEMELGESREDPGRRFDFGGLRRELGM